MKVFDLRKFVVDNGVYVKEYPTAYYEYKVGDSDYSVRLAKGRYYNNVIVFMYKDKYIHSVDIRREDDKVKELEKLSEECNNISEVMDYYSDKYMEKKRIEAEEQKKLDSFMLKGGISNDCK